MPADFDEWAAAGNFEQQDAAVGAFTQARCQRCN